jgi:hypothetical protein
VNLSFPITNLTHVQSKKITVEQAGESWRKGEVEEVRGRLKRRIMEEAWLKYQELLNSTPMDVDGM